MKLNLQRSPLYIYMLFNDYDGFKVISVFEDMDETDLKFNINCNCNKKKFKFLADLGESKVNRNNKSLKNSFYNEFF